MLSYSWTSGAFDNYFATSTEPRSRMSGFTRVYLYPDGATSRSRGRDRTAQASIESKTCQIEQVQILNVWTARSSCIHEETGAEGLIRTAQRNTTYADAARHVIYEEKTS